MSGEPLTIVSIASLKGGVGKTTLAFVLAATLVSRDEHVHALMVDLDLEGTDLLDGVGQDLAEPKKSLCMAEWLCHIPSLEGPTSVPIERLLWVARGSDPSRKRFHVLPSQVRGQDLDRVQRILFSESYSSHVLCQVLRLGSAYLKWARSKDKKASVVLFLDCGPGMCAAARSAFCLEEELPHVWSAPHGLHSGPPRCVRLLVAGPERQGLLAGARYVVDHPSQVAEGRKRGEWRSLPEDERKSRAELWALEYLKKTWLIVNRLRALDPSGKRSSLPVDPAGDELGLFVVSQLWSADAAKKQLWNQFTGGDPGKGSKSHMVVIRENQLPRLFDYDSSDGAPRWSVLPKDSVTGLESLLTDLLS